MWIYTKPRNEHDNRFLVNLDLSSRVNLSQLGERWFVEVLQGTDSFPIAAADSEQEARDMMRRLFEAMQAGEKALDMGGEGERRKETGEGKARVPT